MKEENADARGRLPNVIDIGYGGVMSFGRHVLHMVLTAIVMIAVHVMPSAASAHEGHGGHGTRAAHHATIASPPTDLLSVAAPERPMTVAAEGTSIAASAFSTRGQTCTAGCPACAGSGVPGCCAGAMIASAAAGLPGRAGPSVVLTTRDLPVPSGIGPEALPEPPRPIA